MKQTWERIEAWLDRNSRMIGHSLNPGAESGALKKLEKDFGVVLRRDFKTSCSIHNGQEGPNCLFDGHWHLLPINHIEDQWKLMKDLWDEGVFEGTDGVEPDPQSMAEKELSNFSWL